MTIYNGKHPNDQTETSTHTLLGYLRRRQQLSQQLRNDGDSKSKIIIIIKIKMLKYVFFYFLTKDFDAQSNNSVRRPGEEFERKVIIKKKKEKWGRGDSRKK
jgi:hypothetical protein